MFNVLLLRTQLRARIDPAYKDFGDSLQPGITNRLGVRMPDLRKMASDILRSDPVAFLTALLKENDSPTSQEEVFLLSIVLGRASLSLAERLDYLTALLPYLDGWATVDLTGGELKVFREEDPRLTAYLGNLLTDERPMVLRLGLVILLSHYAGGDRLGTALRFLGESRAYGLARSHYLMSMGLAWCLATLFVSDPPRVERKIRADFEEGRLDLTTLRRTLQKIRDSRRVTPSQKASLTARFSELIARTPSNLA